MKEFTLSEAREVIPRLRAHVERLVIVRADLADAQAALERGEQPVGGLPQVKALEARLQEGIDWFGANGIQLKGIAPVIVDFPSHLDLQPALLCWLEGEESLSWWHSPEVGFLGRRRLEQ